MHHLYTVNHKIIIGLDYRKFKRKKINFLITGVCLNAYLDEFNFQTDCWVTQSGYINIFKKFIHVIRWGWMLIPYDDGTDMTGQQNGRESLLEELLLNECPEGSTKSELWVDVRDGKLSFCFHDNWFELVQSTLNFMHHNHKKPLIEPNPTNSPWQPATTKNGPILYATELELLPQTYNEYAHIF